MIIVEKNEGPKISYVEKGTKITFDDELMLNLAKYERDEDNHIDVCRDKDRKSTRLNSSHDN